MKLFMDGEMFGEVDVKANELIGEEYKIVETGEKGPRILPSDIEICGSIYLGIQRSKNSPYSDETPEIRIAFHDKAAVEFLRDMGVKSYKGLSGKKIIRYHSKESFDDWGYSVPA